MIHEMAGISKISYNNGKNNPFYGKHHTEETKQKMRNNHADFSKEKNPNFGKHLSEETRKKISEIRMQQGYTHSIDCMCGFCKSKKGLLKGSKNPFFDKKHSKSSLKKMSEIKKGKYVSPITRAKLSKSHKGLFIGEKNPMFGIPPEKHPSWIDGRSYLPYSPKFNKHLKKKIKYRDNFICLLCMISEEEHIKILGCGLSIHHIDYNKNNSSEDNLITLCFSCNSSVNLNRDFWEQHFSERMVDVYG